MILLGKFNRGIKRHGSPPPLADAYLIHDITLRIPKLEIKTSLDPEKH
jgi:hypothetical protein